MPRAKLKHTAAVHVALTHQRPDLRHDTLGSRLVLRHDLQREALAHPAILASERHDNRAIGVGHQPEPGLHTRDGFVLAERDRDVLDGAEFDGVKPLRPAHQFRQAGAIALHQRQADHLDLATGAPGVDCDLEVWTVPTGKRSRHDWPLSWVASEMLAQTPTHRRFWSRRLLLRPLRQPLDRARELFRLHPAILAPDTRPGAGTDYRSCAIVDGRSRR